MTTPGADAPLPPPPEAAFDADAALVQLKRAVREMKFVERGNHFELRGKRVLELNVASGAIEARIARQLAQTPEWDRQAVDSAVAQRKLLDDLKKRLARWERED